MLTVSTPRSLDNNGGCLYQSTCFHPTLIHHTLYTLLCRFTLSFSHLLIYPLLHFICFFFVFFLHPVDTTGLGIFFFILPDFGYIINTWSFSHACYERDVFFCPPIPFIYSYYIFIVPFHC